MFSMQKSIGIGMIGLGWVSNQYMKSFLNNDFCEVLAICDIDVEKAEKIKEKNIDNAIKDIIYEWQNETDNKKQSVNDHYFSTVEMAVTDWGKGSETNAIDFKEKLKPSVIISDEASGFTDPQFWGEYNVIEPEKSIDSAIKKIQKQLEKKK